MYDGSTVPHEIILSLSRNVYNALHGSAHICADSGMLKWCLGSSCDIHDLQADKSTALDNYC